MLFRLGVILTTLLAAASAAAPAAAQITGALPSTSSTPALKRQTLVTGEIVRIGDVIDNAGASARVPIFRAPDLGQTGTVSAARVVEAVRPHGFAIVETYGVTEVAVTRASRTFTVKDLEQRIADVLAGQPGLGEARNLTVTIERDARTLQIEPNADLHPARVSYVPQWNRFDITFEVTGVAAGNAKRAPLRYTGTVVETTDALVLTRALGRNDVIRASDVAIERKPKAEVRGNVAVAMKDAVGLAVRRPLQAGELIRAADLAKPDLIQRNDMVTIVYQAPGLLLTLRGKAADAGAMGDTISVLNIQSKRTVQGTITGPGQVTIAAPAPRVISQADATQTPGAARQGE
jgi:flagellar basal body P-ring formation protein FlgA